MKFYTQKLKLYRKVRYDERIQKAREQLGGKCVSCGSVECLDFDHIDPSTKYKNITDMTSESQEKFDEELAKCQLLCRECHTKKTLKDYGLASGRSTHGTLASYRYCKCDLCKRAWSEHGREYRKKKFPDRQPKKIAECGSRSKYLKGCRCSECKHANNLFNLEYQKKKRQQK